MDGNVALGCGWCSGWDTKPCLTHLCLILEFAPWLLSHLLFLPSLHKKKIKEKRGEIILNFSNCLIYLECQIFGKKSLTTGLMDHGAAFLAGGHRNYMKAKEIRGRKAKGKFQISMLCQAAASSPWQQGWFSSCWEKTALEREMSEQHRGYKVSAPYLLKRRCICILVSSS